jgi:hypothetical protein
MGFNSGLKGLNIQSVYCLSAKYDTHYSQMIWKSRLAFLYNDILESENLIMYSIILVEDIPLSLK